MGQLARLPNDLIFFTQITMEAAEDPEFLNAMRRAHIRGALVGVESVTPEGLRISTRASTTRASFGGTPSSVQAKRHTCAGSFIFGLPSDRWDFEATVSLAERAGVTFAQFVMLTPFLHG
jgi:hypothetical protein